MLTPPHSKRKSLAVSAIAGDPLATHRLSSGKFLAIFVISLLAIFGLVQNVNAEADITEGPLSFNLFGTEAYLTHCLRTESGSITIPSEVVSDGRSFPVIRINGSAFEGCSSLISVIIPDSVSYIETGAFRGCSSLTGITIPDHNPTISDWTFRECSSLTSIIIPDSVTSIGNYAFAGCSSLTSITIPDSVTSIDIYAFEGCSSLTSITIPDGVTSIGNYAFAGCSSLARITIPGGVTSIGNYAFAGCSSLGSITIPRDVTSIGNYAFEGCSRLASITIPGGVTSIGTRAFEGCSSLASVTIPAGVTELYGAFYNCSSLTSVSLPAGLRSLYETFAWCSNLTSITLPDGVTTIGDGAFVGCSLTSIVIPSSVSDIGDWAFQDCNSLTSVVIPKSVTSIGEGAFYNCSSLTRVVISSSSGIIEGRVFENCSSLSRIVIYNGVTSIGEWAFRNCTSLTSVVMPKSLTSIGEMAFYDSSNMISCLFLGDAPTVEVGLSNYNLCVFYHSGAVGFTTANGWSDAQPISSKLSIGIVVEARGQMTVIRDGNHLPMGKVGSIYLGDKIKTGIQSYAKIALFDDGVVLTMGSNSSIVIDEDYITPNGLSVYQIIRGKILFYKTPGGKNIRIKSKSIAIGVKGTTLSVEVNEEGGVLTTTTEVLEGLVDHENLATGEVIELRTGESAYLQSAVETRTLTIYHTSTSLGGVWLNDVEITSFPYVVNYDEGTEFTLRVVSSATGVFSSWSGDIVSANSEYTFTLGEDMTVTANLLEWTDYDSAHPALEPDEDANGNGLSNFLVYATGQNPIVAGTLPIVELSDGFLTVRRRLNGSDATPVIEYTDNLVDWFPLEEGTHYTLISKTVEGEMLTLTLELVVGQAELRFFRQRFGR